MSRIRTAGFLLACLALGLVSHAHAQTAPITISPPTLPDGMVGDPYNQTLTASGGTGTGYVFSLTGGALPPGLSLQSGGTIDGTPTASDTFGFIVTVTDSVNTTNQAYTLTIAAPPIVVSPPTLPDGTVGAPYSQDFDASGGTSPYSFAITAGSLPPGLSLGGDGSLLNGTPESAGSFGFTVTATDQLEQTGERAYTLVIQSPVITLAPSTLPNGTIGVDYNETFTASGGTGPYTFAQTGGALPPGLFLSSDGTLNGAPTTSGSFGFTVTATDNFNQTGTQTYTLTVDAATILLTPATLPNGIVGTPYSQDFDATGGTAPYSFAITAGSLPPGLSLGGDGSLLDGTPESAGSFGFTVTATDQFDQTAERAYTLVIQSPVITLAPSTLPNGTIGVEYSQTFTASGGTGPYTFAHTGTLPPGLFLSSDGTLNGAPTASGSFGFTVTATDSFNQTGAQGYTLIVDAALILLTPATLPNGVVGFSYSQAFSATGGTAPYSFAITAGSLPPGLSLGGSLLNGMPESAGSFGFTVTATDQFNQTAERAYTLVVQSPVITLAPSTLPNGAIGVDYSQTFTASGGSGAYTFARTAGTLPPGLFLSSDGTLNGAPTASGSFGFSVTATDSLNQTGTQAYMLTVDAATILLTPATLPNGTEGTPYSQDLDATGGSAPYSFAITAGSLPPGLSLGGDGSLLSGTPESSGSFSFTVTATDAFETTGSRNYTLNVGEEIRDVPTEDPVVVTSLVSQVSTVDIVGTTQIVNFIDRLDEIHDGGGGSDSDDGSGSDSTPGSPWGFWVSGSIRQGDRDATGTTEAMSFETSGLSSGGDYRLSDSFAFGAGLGYARDRTMVGDNGSRNDSEAKAGVAYGSWRPQGEEEGSSPFFLDGMFGHQPLKFELRRFVPDTGIQAAQSRGQKEIGHFVEAERNGRQQFTSWQGGYEYRNEADTLLVVSYGRLDMARTRLNAFTERGDPDEILHYSAQEMGMRRATAGLRVKYRMDTRWGEFEPRLRLEFQQDNLDVGNLSVRYANDPDGPSYVIKPTAGLDNNRLIMNLGGVLRSKWGLLIRVNYLAVFGGANDTEHGLSFSFQDDE